MSTFPNVFVSEHPLIHQCLTLARDRNTGVEQFRRLLGQIARLMAFELTRDYPTEDIDVETQKAQISLRDDVVKLALGSAEMLVNQKLDDETHRRLIREYIDNLGEMPNA